MKLDIKSAAIGILGCFILTLAFGYTGTSDTQSDSRRNVLFPTSVTWAMIVPSDGRVLVRAIDGRAFIVDVDSAKAKRVEFDPRKFDIISEPVVLSGKD